MIPNGPWCYGLPASRCWGCTPGPDLTHVVQVEWRDGRVAIAGPEPGS
jgi:hypothetical protein